MRRPYREHHLLQLLAGYEEQTLPLDRYMSTYFRENKALGSKDRGYIAETIYGMVRWLNLLDHLSKIYSWEKRFETFQNFSPEKYFNDPRIAKHTQVSFPKDLYNRIIASHGIEQGTALCQASNTAAPTTVRANAQKISRDALLQQWKEKYDVFSCSQAPCGITFGKKMNFFVLTEFQEGLFEVQDEGSQLLAAAVDAKPGDQVMDYCSGSGGKTLAFAPEMKGKGQIFLHDIRPKILIEARRRLKRAGIQNAQTIDPDSPNLKKLKKKMDWVLVDAPCSGTGTLRRNPDMKYKYTDAMLKRLVGEQRAIFEKALSFVKPGGHIVYGTCSLLKEENQEQVAHFLETYPLELVGEPFQSLPEEGGMDGFFGATFKFKGEK